MYVLNNKLVYSWIKSKLRDMIFLWFQFLFPSNMLVLILYDLKTSCSTVLFSTELFVSFCTLLETHNGTETGSVVYGGSLVANTWHFRVGDLEGIASTTQDNCVPIGEIWSGKLKRGRIKFLCASHKFSKTSHFSHSFKIFLCANNKCKNLYCFKYLKIIFRLCNS